jgi:hypothetical protein
VICLASRKLFRTRSRGYERWRKMTWKPEQTANPVQTTGLFGVKRGGFRLLLTGETPSCATVSLFYN